jgi:RimJ/RimL family protein N-acetyltransferase
MRFGAAVIRDDALMAADRPPEHIEIEDIGVVLRRHRADDLDALHAVIEENRDHLRSFMPWADQARAQTAEFLERAVADWDAGTNFNFLITVAPSGDDPEEILGGTGLHARGEEGSFEIGYWLSQTATGRGVITAAARRLTDIALAMHGVDAVEIHCDEANVKSAAVPRRLGYVLDRIIERPPAAPGEHGRLLAWVRRTPRS